MGEYQEHAPEVDKASILFKTLETVTKDRKKEALDAKEIDPKVGIGVAELPEIEPIEFEGQTYYFYAARVFAQKEGGAQPFVTPHNHHKGVEPYLFDGEGGEMNFGYVSPDGKKVSWKNPINVATGDKILIQEGEVHSFRNNGAAPVDFLFACPKSHLVDFSDAQPEGDRFIVKDLENGIPPHYQLAA